LPYSISSSRAAETAAGTPQRRHLANELCVSGSYSYALLFLLTSVKTVTDNDNGNLNVECQHFINKHVTSWLGLSVQMKDTATAVLRQLECQQLIEIYRNFDPPGKIFQWTHFHFCICGWFCLWI